MTQDSKQPTPPALASVSGSAPPDYNPSGIVECTSCGKHTSILEAECRRFNRGRCGKCGGPLFPIERKRVKAQNESS